MTATPAGKGRGTSLLPDEGGSPGSLCRHCGEFILTPGNGGSLGFLLCLCLCGRE